MKLNKKVACNEVYSQTREVEEQVLPSDYGKGGGNCGREYDMILVCLKINNLAVKWLKKQTPPLQARWNSVSSV